MTGNTVRVSASIAFTLILLTLPLASAMTVQGHLLLAGPTEFPSGTVVQLDSLAVFSNSTSAFTTFTLRAESMTVTLYEIRSIGVPGIAGARVENTERTWKQTDVDLTLLQDGDHDGYFGVKAGPDGSMEATVFSTTEVESRSETLLSTGAYPIRPAPDYPAFHEHISQPHLYAKTPASILYQGSGKVHVNGLDFLLHASENETSVEWRTGHVQTSPVEIVLRWFVFETDGAVIKFTSGHPVEMAGREGSVAWNGEARMTAVDGALRGPSGTYRATGDASSLDGTLTADATPTPDAGGIQLANLQGSLRATNLEFQPMPLASHGATWFPWIALAVVVTAGGGVGTLLWQQARRIDPITAEDYLQHSTILFETGDYRGALTWARRACKIAPKMPTLAAQEAMCHAALDDVPRAVKAYQEAHRHANHGKYALAAARLLKDKGWPPEAVAPHLTAALEKSPEALLEIDTEFDGVAESPSWDAVRSTVSRFP